MPSTSNLGFSGSSGSSLIPIGASLDSQAPGFDSRAELVPLAQSEPVHGELPSDLHDLPSVEELSAMLNEALDLKEKRASRKMVGVRSDAINE